MSGSEPQWAEQPRIWREPPPAWPLRGSWALTSRLSVVHGHGQVSFYLDGSKNPAGGQLKPLWRSVPLRTKRPGTYADAIPMLSIATWELGIALQGMHVVFEGE